MDEIKKIIARDGLAHIPHIYRVYDLPNAEGVYITEITKDRVIGFEPDYGRKDNRRWFNVTNHGEHFYVSGQSTNTKVKFADVDKEFTQYFYDVTSELPFNRKAMCIYLTYHGQKLTYVDAYDLASKIEKLHPESSVHVNSSGYQPTKSGRHPTIWRKDWKMLVKVAYDLQ